MVTITDKKLNIEESLVNKISFICDFVKLTPTFINGSVKRINKTNLTYVEPHKVIIKEITFLLFNYSTDIYVENLSNKIKISDLEEYLKVN